MNAKSHPREGDQKMRVPRSQARKASKPTRPTQSGGLEVVRPLRNPRIAERSTCAAPPSSRLHVPPPEGIAGHLFSLMRAVAFSWGCYGGPKAGRSCWLKGERSEVGMMVWKASVHALRQAPCQGGLLAAVSQAWPCRSRATVPL